VIARRMAVAALLPLLSGCPLLVTFGLSAAGGAGGTLATLRLAEADVDLAIRLGEDGACLIKARDQQHGQRVSNAANELCAALLLEKSGGVP